MKLKNYISSKYFKDGLITLPKGIKKIKIDVGLSFSAPISWEWLENDPEVVCFGFEPNTNSLEILHGQKSPDPLLKSNQFKKTNIKKHIGDRFFILPYALGRNNSEKEFYNVINKTDNSNSESDYEYESGSSSLYEPIHMKYTKSIVKVYNLYTFLSNFNWSSISSITQIKIDAQGEDFNIIYGLKQYLKKVEVISYEINAPGYFGYKNYKLKNLKLFFHMIINGFYPFKRTASEITYRNFRFINSKDNFYSSGT